MGEDLVGDGELQAGLAGARFNLEQTTVRAPADDYVTNIALRPGARVGALPLAPVRTTGTSSAA